MASQNYNRNIFTNVRKWDSTLSYTGIKLTGKINQVNGQDYPLVDAIDIDWDGAFLESMSTYINTTEELIYNLNLIGRQGNDTAYSLTHDYLSLSYYAYLFEVNKQDMIDLIEEKSQYAITYIEDNVVSDLITKYEILNEISDFVVDRSRYIEIDYSDIVSEDGQEVIGTSEYYIYYNHAFVKVDNEYILSHPDDKYYYFLIHDMVMINKSISAIAEILGVNTYSEISMSYTGGMLGDINRVSQNITRIYELLASDHEYIDSAYELAYNATVKNNQQDNVLEMAYANTYLNTEKIGYHTSYNVYKLVEEWNQDVIDKIHDDGNIVYVKDDDGNLVAMTYNSNYQGDCWIHYSKIPGTGIELEIENISDLISDNSYLLYWLSAQNDNEDYVKISLTPSMRVDPHRKITLSMVESNVERMTGSITRGVVTENSLVNSFAYFLNWKIL